MIYFRNVLWLVALIFSVGAGSSIWAQPASAQSDEAPSWELRELQVIAMAVDVIAGGEELYLLDPELQPLQKIRLRKLLFGRAFTCTTFDGVAYFGVPGAGDSTGQAPFRLLASVEIASGLSQAAIIFIPREILTGRAEDATRYDIRAFDGSQQRFPLGGTMVMNLLPTQIVLKIGEEKRSIQGQASAMIDAVSELDSFNMADVSFFYRSSDQWNILKQSKIRYLPNVRYTAIAYFDTRIRKPTIVFVRDGGRIH